MFFPRFAAADGALAIGLTDDPAKDGVAVGYIVRQPTADIARTVAMDTCRAFKTAPEAAKQCRLIGTFNDQCVAVAVDSTPGTPGVGWAVAPDKQAAEQRAVGECQATAGPSRREFCAVARSTCDRE